jgi:dTDP-4-amino-4,6-dideoxygalactose transaminase
MTEKNIPFNIPPDTGAEFLYLMEAVETNQQICGDGEFTKRVSSLLERMFGANKVLLTTSCTHALEMAALLAGIEQGDEVIMPSFTFVSTANAFVLRGARIKFVDIRPDTMNIDESQIEQAITSRTKAIVPVHYAGVSCDMATIQEIADRHQLYVIEDAAQGVMSSYRGEALGVIGDFGCYSFHETKNYSMGEGGALLVNNPQLVEQAEIIREKGTNRSKFLRGQIDKYSWVSLGSSYLPSELNVAYLFPQMLDSEGINQNRLAAWDRYYHLLRPLMEKGVIELPHIPSDCQHNAHMFYLKCKDLEERTDLISHLKSAGITASFHYVPLHSSLAGRQFGDFIGADVHTTVESERLVRLPLYYGIKSEDVEYVVDQVSKFFMQGVK